MKTEALGYFCLGAAFGVAASVLFAPKSGPETRAYLASTAGDGTDYVKARVDEVRTAATNLVDRGKQTLKQQSTNLTDALEAGKQACREASQPVGL